MARDLAEFGCGSNEGCHLVAERFPKMVFNLRRSRSSFLPRASKTTLPLAIKVSTPEKPRNSNSRRNRSIFTVLPPTLIARRKAKSLGTPDLPPNDVRPGADRRSKTVSARRRTTPRIVRSKRARTAPG